MIPKKIHYFWFGKGKKSDLTEFCIESWKKNQPDFEIIEWNEANFDVSSNIFVKEAYKNKKWAFVSDYARAKVLYEEGGFYLDTDMEIKYPLHEFIKYRAVCGFEIKGTPFSAFFATEKNHPLAKDMIEYYDSQTEFSEIPNTKIFSKLLVDKYAADAQNDHLQEVNEGIMLFPSEYFSLDLPKNYITHHFSGSWHGAWSAEKNSYKSFINTYGLIKLFSEIPDAKKEIKNLVFNHRIVKPDEILDQIPLSYIASYLKKQLRKKFKI